jgi:hypothetical protein
MPDTVRFAAARNGPMIVGSFEAYDIEMLVTSSQ